MVAHSPRAVPGTTTGTAIPSPRMVTRLFVPRPYPEPQTDLTPGQEKRAHELAVKAAGFRDQHEADVRQILDTLDDSPK